ncbi:MAG: ClpX C4-type zinc finger protein, partial [Candidatus Thiodiazotropha sp. (ex Dulcina madagascariensis)]|nr:ClpX C4-type zinc finger protein [Candidatus Thiodiazotropha sp. (ex Dulcina madagascariensis)]
DGSVSVEARELIGLCREGFGLVVLKTILTTLGRLYTSRLNIKEMEMHYDLNCSFCGSEERSDLVSFFPGSGVSIFGDCVSSALQAILTKSSTSTTNRASLLKSQKVSCSFCRTPASEVKWMHSHNNKHICSKCLVFCVDIALEGEKSLPFTV